MAGYEPTAKAIRVLNDAYRCSLQSGSKLVDQPPEIKVALRPHQQAILYEMEQRETGLSRGMDISGSRLYSRFSFLGDGVGVGKSLMVLGHIARLKRLPKLDSIPLLDTNSTPQIYSLHENLYGQDLSEVGSLIVVPHTLYRQWQTYIKEQTTLNFFGVQTKKTLEEKNPNEIAKKIKEADVVLVSNTLYGPLMDYAHMNRFLWKRVFLDEADTLHLPSTRRMFDTRFTWLISASWTNLLFPNICHYISQPLLDGYMSNQEMDRETKSFLRANFQQSQTSTYV
jgi:hypothetical protein